MSTAKRGDSRGSSRELVRLCAIPRGRSGSEELRLSLDEFEPDDGDPARYVNVRLWFRDHSGEWRPSAKGLTFRRGEVAKVLEALQRGQRILEGKETPSEPKKQKAPANQRSQSPRPEPRPATDDYDASGDEADPMGAF